MKELEQEEEQAKDETPALEAIGEAVAEVEAEDVEYIENNVENTESTVTSVETVPEPETVIPAVLEVNESDLSISAYSQSEADEMAMMFGLKPMPRRTMLKSTKSAPAETMTRDAQNPETETATQTGFAAFDISLKNSEETQAGSYIVNIHLSEPVVLPQMENMEITGVTYELYHIQDGTSYPTLVNAEFNDNKEEGLLYGFSFETDGFSPYVLKYTVDFTFIGTKEEEPSEEELKEKTYTYVFQGMEDRQLLSYILATNELYVTVQNTTVDDEEAVSLDEDLYLVPLKYFDLVTLTVEDEEGKQYTILLSNPAPTIASYIYEFTDEKQSVLLSEILGEDYVLVSAAAADETLLSVEPAEGDYEVTALAHFDETTVTGVNILAEQVEILFRNPAPAEPGEPIPVPAESVTLGEADVTEAAAALGIEEATVEQTLTDEEGGEYTLYSKTGFIGLDIDIDESLKTEDGLYTVPVTLAEPVRLVDEEYAQIQNAELKLWHVDGEPTEITDVTFRVEEGVLYGFTFMTDSFSPYLVSYTVDFTIAAPEIGGTAAWSWPGRGSYAIRDILDQIGIEGEISKVTLEKIIDKGGADNALYLEEKEDGWYLTSEVPFEDTFELDITVDHTVYMFYITDAQTGEGDTFLIVEFKDEDGNSISGTVNGYYYLQIRLPLQIGPGPASNYYHHYQITNFGNIEAGDRDRYNPSRGWGGTSYAEATVWGNAVVPVASVVQNRNGANHELWNMNDRTDAASIDSYVVKSVSDAVKGEDEKYHVIVTLIPPKQLKVNISYYDFDSSAATPGAASRFAGTMPSLPEGNKYIIAAYSSESWSNLKNWNSSTPWAIIPVNDPTGSTQSVTIDSFKTDWYGGNGSVSYADIMNRSDFDINNVKVRYVNIPGGTINSLGSLANRSDYLSILNGGMEGYDFMPSSYQSFEDKTDPESAYRVALKRGYDKQFNVVLDYSEIVDGTMVGDKNIASGGSLTQLGNSYYVRLEATTSSGQKVNSLVPISGTSGTSTIHIGDKSYTVTTTVDTAKRQIKIELPLEAWTNGQKFSENWPSVSAAIVKPNGGASLDVGDITNPDQKKFVYAYNLGVYSYADQGMTTQNGDYTQNNYNTEYQYIYKLTAANFENAISPESILGEAAEYGIVADTYIQHGHTETNFAVNHLNDNSNIDIDGSGDSAMPFYAGDIEGTLWISHGTLIPVDVFVTPEDIAAGKLNMTVKDYEIIPTAQATINSYVNGLISAGNAKSSQMASKVTIRPQKLSDLKEVDLRDFPDGVTVYIDCSDIKENIIENDGWTMKKWDNQYLVFNIPGSDVEVHEFYVETYNYDTKERTNRVQSTTAALNGDPGRNQLVDDVIFSHICFNMPEATNVHLHNASALFLCPEAEMVTQDNGAGWILAKGTVDSTSEWHFYRHYRHYTSVSEGTQVKLTKKLTDSNGNEISYVDPGYSFTLYQVKNSGSGEPADWTNFYAANEFTQTIFKEQLVKTDENGESTGTTEAYPATVSTAAGGVVVFRIPKIKNSEVDVNGNSQASTNYFYFVIKENRPDGLTETTDLGYYKDGVLYNQSEIRLKMEAADDGAGKIDLKLYALNGNIWKEISNASNTFDFGDFENNAATGSATVKGWKKIENGTISDADVEEFSFTLKAVTSGAPMPTKVETVDGKTVKTIVDTVRMTSKDDPTFTFEAIPFELADLNTDSQGNPIATTFEYTLVENGDRSDAGITNDSHEHTVKITVRPSTAEEAAVAISSGTVAKDAYPLVTTVEYYLDGEKVTSTSTENEIVPEDFDLSALFTNAAKTNLTLAGGKKLTGRDMKADEFTFNVYEYLNSEGESLDPLAKGFTVSSVAESNIVSTGTNKASAALKQDDDTYLAEALIDFTSIVYEDVGTHYYLIREVDPVVDGLVYDTSEYVVKVEVAVDETEGSETKGEMVAKVTEIRKVTYTTDEMTGTTTSTTNDITDSTKDLKDLITFENNYKAVTTLEANKAIDGIQGTRNYFMAGDHWTFALTGEDLTDSTHTDIPMPDISKSSAANITYTDETSGNSEAIISQDSTTGAITYELVFTEDKPKPTGEGENRVLYTEPFDFGELSFDKGDVGHIYRYTVTESGVVDGIQNDGAKYVDIQITENADGSLNIVKLPGHAKAEFVNYAAETTQMTVEKIWEPTGSGAGEVEMTLIAVRSENVTPISRNSRIKVSATIANDDIPSGSVVTFKATAASPDDPSTFTTTWTQTTGKTEYAYLGGMVTAAGGTTPDSGELKDGKQYTVTLEVVGITDANGAVTVVGDSAKAVATTGGESEVSFNAKYGEPADAKIAVSVQWSGTPSNTVQAKVTAVNPNDNTDRQEILLTGANSGTIEGLKRNTTYTVSYQITSNDEGKAQEDTSDKTGKHPTTQDITTKGNGTEAEPVTFGAIYTNSSGSVDKIVFNVTSTNYTPDNWEVRYINIFSSDYNHGNYNTGNGNSVLNSSTDTFTVSSMSSWWAGSQNRTDFEVGVEYQYQLQIYNLASIDDVSISISGASTGGSGVNIYSVNSGEFWGKFTPNGGNITIHITLTKTSANVLNIKNARLIAKSHITISDINFTSRTTSSHDDIGVDQGLRDALAQMGLTSLDASDYTVVDRVVLDGVVDGDEQEPWKHTWYDLPKVIKEDGKEYELTYYVVETSAAWTARDEHESWPSVAYDESHTYAGMTNTKSDTAYGAFKVTKKVTGAGASSTPRTFFIGISKDPKNPGETISKPKQLTVPAGETSYTMTFGGYELPAEEIWYIYETDETGKVLETGSGKFGVFTLTSVGSNESANINGHQVKATAETSQMAEIIFTNSYSANGTYRLSDTRKAIEGRRFREGDSFRFHMVALDGGPLPDGLDTEGDLLVSPASGYSCDVDFGNFHFTSDDFEGVSWNSLGTRVKTFKYNVYEVAGAESNMTYDTAVRTLTRIVTDDGSGTITATHTWDRENGGTFINRSEQYYCVAVTKEWDDNNNQDGKRPDSIDVALFKTHTFTEDLVIGQTTVAAGTYYCTADNQYLTEKTPYATVILNEDNGWTYLYRGVPYADVYGNMYEYFWQEYTTTTSSIYNSETGTTTVYTNYQYTDLNGIITFDSGVYTLTRSEATQTVDDWNGKPMVVTTLTNTHVPETVQVKATKTWVDTFQGMENYYGKRASVQFRITGYYYENGTRHYLTDTDIIDQTQTVSSTATGEDLTVTWNNLPRYEQGKPITYNVHEVAVPDGYKGEYIYYTLRTTSTTGDNGEITTTTEVVENVTSNARLSYYDAEGNAIPGGALFARNTLQLGAIQIYKDVVIDGSDVVSTLNTATGEKENDLYTAVTQKEFYVKVFLAGSITDPTTTKKGSYVCRVGDRYELYKTDWNDTSTRLTIRVGEPLLIDNLPFGTYTVVEVDAQGNEITDQSILTLNGGNFVYNLSTTAVNVVVDDAYTAAHQGTNSNGQPITIPASGTYRNGTIVNAFQTNRFCVGIVKRWDDMDDRDGVRPDSIYAALYKSANAGGTTYWYDELDRGYAETHDGDTVTYVYSPKAPTSSSTTGEGDEAVTTYTYENTVLTIKPTYATGRLSDTNDWAWMKRGVAEKDENGNAFRYTWSEYKLAAGKTEDEPENRIFVEDTETDHDGSNVITFIKTEGGVSRTAAYIMTQHESQKETISGTGDEANEVTVITTITNTHEPEKRKVRVTKVWDENTLTYNLHDNVIVTMTLVGYYTTTETVEGEQKEVRHYVTDVTENPVQEISSWEREAMTDRTWTNLPKYYEGHELYYEVIETPLDDFITTYGTEGTVSAGVSDVEWTKYEADKPEKAVHYAYTDPDGTEVWEYSVKNTLKLGRLTVGKNLFVDGKQVQKPGDGETTSELYTAHGDKKFYFTLTYLDGTNLEWYVYDQNGTLKVSHRDAVTNAETGATITSEENNKPHFFEITADSTLSFSNLPVGAYRITEYVMDSNGTIEDEAGKKYAPVGDIGSMTLLPDLSRTGTKAEELISVGPYSAEQTVTDGQGNTTTTPAMGEVNYNLVNTYVTGRYCLAVTKQWIVNGKIYSGEDLPEIAVKLERTTGDPNGTGANAPEWKPVPDITMGSAVVGNPADSESTPRNYILLNSDNNWSAVAVGMEQMDKDGNRYSYRWVEYAVTRNGNDVTVASASGAPEGWIQRETEKLQSTVKDAVTDTETGNTTGGTTLVFLTKLKNEKTEKDIEVTKVWTDGRWPDDTQVEVTLQSKVDVGEFTKTETNIKPTHNGTPILTDGGNAVVTLSGAISSAKWAKLPVYDSNGKKITYQVVETKITVGTGDKAVVYTIAGNEDGVKGKIEDYYTSSTSVKENTKGDAEITISNEVKKGKLIITKSISGQPSTEDLSRIKFNITGPSGFTEQVIFLANFKVQTDGTYKYELDQVPLGTYTVTENTDTARITNYTLIVDGDNASITRSTAEVVPATGEGTTAEGTVALSNRYERDKGNLSIHKFVESPIEADLYGENALAFTFTIQLSDTTISNKLAYSLTTKDQNGTETTEEKTVENGIQFTGGQATVTLKHDQTIVIKGIETGVTYTITETPNDLFNLTRHLYDTGEITTENAQTAEFTNTRKTGELSVTKTVISQMKNDPLMGDSKTYAIEVTLRAAAGKTYQASRQTGDGTPTTEDIPFDADGKTTINLHHEETVTIQGLPYGVDYSLAETTDSQTGFVVTYTGKSGTMKEHTGAVVTNTKMEGNLKLQKLLESKIVADQNQEFRFKVSLKDGNGQPVDGATFIGTLSKPGYDINTGANNATLTRTREITFNNGTAYVDLKGGEMMTIAGIPEGYTYVVTENAHEGFAIKKDENNQDMIVYNDTTKTILKDDNDQVTITNQRQETDLTISKTVVSDIPADRTKTFDFTVRLTYTPRGENAHAELLSGNYTVDYYDQADGSKTNTKTEAFSDGEATLSIKGGGKAVIHGIPVGASYRVVETTDSFFTVNPANGTVSGTLSAVGETAAFTNTRKKGGLQISKTVDGNTSTDLTKDFTFTITLTNADGSPADLGIANGATKNFEGVLYTKNGDTTTEIPSNIPFQSEYEGTTLKRTYATVVLHSGQRIVLSGTGDKGLPVGLNYEVTERAEAGFIRTQTGQIGTIQENTEGPAQFLNTRAESGLIISKSVFSDISTDKTKEFDFTLTLWDSNGTLITNYDSSTSEPNAVMKRDVNQTAGLLTDHALKTNAQGQYKFKLADGQLLIIKLPEGTRFEVEEDGSVKADGTPDEAFEFNVTRIGNTGSIRSQSANLAEFVNTRKSGKLEIEKTVESSIRGDHNRVFPFIVKLYTEKAVEGQTELVKEYQGGIYGGRSFDKENGTTVYVRGDSSVTIEGIPSGLHYEVDEDLTNLSIFTEKAGATGTTGVISADATSHAKAHFTNTRDNDRLKITKTVESPLAEDSDTYFTYTIILNESISESFTYTVDENGKVKTTGDGAGSFSTITQTDDNGGTVNVPVIVFANGRATVQMKDGGELTINDLPLGITYTVIETANTDFAAEDGLERTGIIQASQSATGLATASYKNIRNTGKLVISKTLSTVRTNDDDLTNKAFTFTVEFGKALKAGTYNAVITRTDTGTKVRDENITLNDSSNTMNGISLKHGETITIEGLPVGLAYEVTEEPQAGYLPTPASGKVSGVITPVTSNGAATAIASFLNTKQEGGLIVSKTMISDVTADNDEFFDFTVTLTGAKLSGLYGEMVFTTSDNVSDNTSTATFKLKHGEKKSATGLPAGLTYKVAEQLTNAQSSVFELLR